MQTIIIEKEASVVNHRKVAYIYEDEAGNYDFTQQGSKYSIMTCVVAHRPFNHLRELLSLKYNCIEDNYNQKGVVNYLRFHASEDLQSIRNAVFSIIQSYIDEFSVYAVVIPKKSLLPFKNHEDKIYSYGFSVLINSVLKHEDQSDWEKLIVITDTIPIKRKRGAAEGAMKSFLKNWSKASGIPYILNHHASESDLNLQIADYFCWAMQRKWERNDSRSYSLINSAIVFEELIDTVNVDNKK